MYVLTKMFYIWIFQNKFCSINDNKSILNEILIFFSKIITQICLLIFSQNHMHITKETFSEEMKTENEPKYEGEQVTVSLSAMSSSRHINKVENVHSTRLYEMVCKSCRNKKLIVLVTFFKTNSFVWKKSILVAMQFAQALKYIYEKKCNLPWTSSSYYGIYIES